jgi:hypothetical protein
MLDGSWLKAHGQERPGEAHGSWPGAGPALGKRRAGPDPDRKRASGSPLVSLSVAFLVCLALFLVCSWFDLGYLGLLLS